MEHGIVLPVVMGFAGKKLAGKDTIIDELVRFFGYEKLHIAEPWLRGELADMGVSWEEWTEHKHLYRAEIQRRGEVIKARDPDVLLHYLREPISHAMRDTSGPGLIISGVRFNNEARFLIDCGGFVVKVYTPDAIRRQRFIEKGEDLALFNDPFEREVDTLRFHMRVPGCWPVESIVPQFSMAFDIFDSRQVVQ